MHNWSAVYLGRTEPGPNAKINCLSSHRQSNQNISSFISTHAQRFFVFGKKNTLIKLPAHKQTMLFLNDVTCQNAAIDIATAKVVMAEVIVCYQGIENSIFSMVQKSSWRRSFLKWRIFYLIIISNCHRLFITECTVLYSP